MMKTLLTVNRKVSEAKLPVRQIYLLFAAICIFCFSGMTKGVGHYPLAPKDPEEAANFIVKQSSKMRPDQVTQKSAGLHTRTRIPARSGYSMPTIGFRKPILTDISKCPGGVKQLLH